MDPEEDVPTPALEPEANALLDGADALLATVQEAGRVLSTGNEAALEAILEACASAPHHPGSARIRELVEGILGRHRAAPGMSIVPVQEAVADPARPNHGSRWLVRLIDEGGSVNGNYWDGQLIESAQFIALCEGADSFEDHDPDEEREQYPVRRVKDHIGVIRNVHVVQEASGKKSLWGELTVLDPNWRTKFLNAAEAGELNRYQISVNAEVKFGQQFRDGQAVRVVEAVRRVVSFDIVTRASAGGRVERLIEAVTRENHRMTPEEIAALAAAVGQAVVAALPQSTPAPAPAQEALTEPAPTPVQVPAPSVPAPEGVLDPAALQQRMEALEARIAQQGHAQIVTEALAGVNLPDTFRNLALGRLNDASYVGVLTATRASEIVQEHVTAAAAAGPQPEAPAPPGPRISGGEEGVELRFKRFEAMLMGGRVQRLQESADDGSTSYTVEPVRDAAGRPVEGFRSLREAYAAFNVGASPWSADIGERIWYALGESSRPNVRGYRSSRDHVRITEALTTATLGEVAQAAMYNALLRHYTAMPYDGWRAVCSDIGVAQDFRTKHYTRIGGYGDLSTVAESATYATLTSPTDEEVTFSIAKRGGLEASITMEMIAADNIGALSRIPQRLAESAKRTLYKFVMNDLIMSNPTLGYDSVTLFHAATHGNLIAEIPSLGSVDYVIRSMENRAPRLASSDILGPQNSPKIFIGHRNLQAAFHRILNPSEGLATETDQMGTATLDPMMFKGQGMRFLPNWFAASGTHWVAVADPGMRDTIILDFFAGRQEPELFIQDDPNVGSMFDNDTQKVKVRHIYGGVTVDHTAFFQGNA